jgi:hypothetical protein
MQAQQYVLVMHAVWQGALGAVEAFNSASGWQLKGDKQQNKQSRMCGSKPQQLATGIGDA